MLEIVSSLKFSQLLNQATTESLITVEADGTVSVRDGAATYLKEITLGLPSVLYASSSLNFTPANTAQSLNLAVQTAGNIFAAPAAVNGSPSFRALVASDIPGLDASKIISGTFSDTFISSAAVWNAKQDALVSGTNIKTVGGQTILGSGDITLASLNYWTKTGFVLSYESTDNATGKATFNGGFEIYSTAPNHSLKQRVTMQTWRTQIGANTGAAGGSYYSIFNVTGGNHGLTVTTDGNVAIGTLPTSESSSNSRLYVYGGATGANIDVRGLDVAFKDQATLELQGSEYSTAYSSTRLQHRGANYGTSVSILGLVTQNFGELTFQEVSGAVIRSTNTTPILVGINNLEVARFLVGGFKVTGSIEYSTTLKPNGNAGTSGYFLKTTGTTNSWSAITLADISDYSAANINYWTLAGANVYRPTGKVFVGHSADMGAYSFQVTGDTVLAGKLNIGNVPNPGAQLEVYGGANFRYPSSDNSAMYVRMGTYISSGLYGTFLKSDSYYAGTLVTNLHLGITDGSATDKILISLIGSTSFVGINTVNPNSRLDVNGDLRVVNGGKFTGQAGTWYNGGQILIDYASSQGRIQAYDGSNSTVKDLLLQWNGGNVGIGASPNSKLHVNGVNARFWLSDSTQNSYYTYFHLDPANGRTLVQAGDSIAYRDIAIQYLGGKLLVGTQSAFTGDTLQVNGSILQRNVIASSILKVLAADSNGTIVEGDQAAVMGVLGDSAYIKNQNGAIQTGNFRISSVGRAAEFYADAVGGNIYAAFGWLRNSYTQFYLYTYGNTENDLRLARYTDVGGYAGNVFIVYRATGKMYFDNSVRIGGGEGSSSYRLDVAETLRVGGQGGTDVTTIGGGSGVGSYLNMYYADGTTNNVLTGNGINALSSYLGGTIIGGFSYSNNNAKLIVRGSSMGNTATGTSSNRAVQISNTDIAYGLHFGVNSNGNSWIQSGRADSTTKYDLWLQHEGSSVIIGNTAAYGSYKLQVFGDIWTNSYLHIRNTSPTILFSDTDNRGAAIHVNSNLLYILRLDDAGTSWQTNSTGLWPFYINLENNNARFGGEIQQEYVKSSLVYANVAGTLIPASAQNVKDLLGDGAYIKNQFAGAQSGNFWVNGTSRVGLYGTTGTTPVFAVTGTHANTSFSLYSIGNGTLDSSLDMWASEPGFTYDGCGIGHNINNNPYGGRRNTSLGQSYIRFYGGHIYISTSGSERTNPSTSAWRFDAGGIFYWGGSANNGQLTWDSGYAALHSINGNRLLLGVAGADTSLMTLTTSAKVLIGTTEENSYKVHINSGSSTGDGLYVYGKIFATDDIQSYSDKRLKENFKDIIIGNKLKDFKIQQYNKIGSHRLQIGVIAQELAEIFPQLVSKEGAYFGVSYSGVATLALGLGIENKNEIEELKEKVLSLQKEIEDLKLK